MESILPLKQKGGTLWSAARLITEN